MNSLQRVFVLIVACVPQTLVALTPAPATGEVGLIRTSHRLTQAKGQWFVELKSETAAFPAGTDCRNRVYFDAKQGDNHALAADVISDEYLDMAYALMNSALQLAAPVELQIVETVPGFCVLAVVNDGAITGVPPEGSIRIDSP